MIRYKKRAIRQVFGIGHMASLLKHPWDCTCCMQSRVERRDFAFVTRCIKKGDIIRAPTLPTGAMPRCKGHGFVVKEQFGIPIGRHQRPLTFLEFCHATYPGLVSPSRVCQMPMIIMKYATVAHEGTTRRVREDFSGRLDTVLQGHGVSLMKAGVACNVYLSVRIRRRHGKTRLIRSG